MDHRWIPKSCITHEGRTRVLVRRAVFALTALVLTAATSLLLFSEASTAPRPDLAPDVGVAGAGGLARFDRAAGRVYLPPGLRPPRWRLAFPDSAAVREVEKPPRSAPSLMSGLPDIQVAWLSRDPLYPAYCVQYPDGWTPTLCPGTENDKHWPDPGEVVTFTAHVANRGSEPTGPFLYRWLIDGNQVLEDTVDNLDPGQWISLTVSWSWNQARHWLTFEADVARAITEISEQNNRLQEATDALYLDIRVHPYVYQAFSTRRNLRGSYTFEDWLQAQVSMMNNRFAQAMYPEAPQGILERVRINTIRVISDVNQGLPNYDGGWQFDVAKDDPDTPENESIESAEEYAAANALGIDWGLIHELTHQLGFIDLYQVGVGAANVLLPGKDGLPLLASYTCRRCDLMGGGDTAPYDDPTYYSSYTAAAINRNYGQRRGYYGEFLFDIPQTNVLVLRDNAGAPLAGAQVEVYQAFWNTLPQTPVISGTSDAAGIFILPNRPVGVEITTATGHTLRANPFGRIDVVGRNGMLLIKISRDGHEDFFWKQILDFNLAYWAGMSETYVISLDTHLPPPDAPPPPAQTVGRFEAGEVSLFWPAQAGAALYRVYQSPDPFDQWQVLTTTGGTALTTRPHWHTRYAVTAVDRWGRESGFGPIYRAFYWVHPVDATYHAGLANYLVLDGHSGALVSLLPDGRVIGNRVRPHWGFVGGQAISRSPAGDLVVLQEGQATLLDNRLRRTAFIASTPREVPRLDNATGVALAGATFSTTVRPSTDANTLLLAHFDGDLNAFGPPQTAVNISFADGISGRGVEIGEGSLLEYAGSGRFIQQQGGLDMWVRPHWQGIDQPWHVFFSAGDGATYLFEVGSVQGYVYAYITNFDGYHEAGAWADVADWRADEWHHIGVAWLPHWLKLYVDGELAETVPLRRAITGTLGALTIGTALGGEWPAEATLDEVRISGIARVGNSDQVRLLVSEGRNGRIKLLDMMGNSLGTWTDRRVQMPRGLTLWGDRQVAVADAGDGSIKLLAYDGGTSLVYASTLIMGLQQPYNISTEGARLLVADYGNRAVKVMGRNGQTTAVYWAPNDGYPGLFGGPAGMARGPRGDLLVADLGKSRVVFVRQAVPDTFIYLPSIWR